MSNEKQPSRKDAYIAQNKAFLDEIRTKEGVKELRGGILYEVIAEPPLTPPDSGKSRQPGPRSIVTCHYKGSLTNGKVFDDSHRRKCPEAFRVNTLINGFQIALVNMHVGDHWRVYIPSEMGYGSHGAGRDIPGHSTLIFEIELLAVG